MVGGRTEYRRSVERVRCQANARQSTQQVSEGASAGTPSLGVGGGLNMRSALVRGPGRKMQVTSLYDDEVEGHCSINTLSPVLAHPFALLQVFSPAGRATVSPHSTRAQRVGGTYCSFSVQQSCIHQGRSSNLSPSATAVSTWSAASNSHLALLSRTRHWLCYMWSEIMDVRSVRTSTSI
ncbi:hypothetical protein OH76DRAFT_1398445 [Lentinus brumalis]|uniref:Uncharacterized protein n=1 Tax=Lentinus brumalis TaxID=2498619 RepID=A0A371DNQ8_9APHY|nr:hypothetical protein OH76DRAFT_1398445 [Polyporus brumalis]